MILSPRCALRLGRFFGADPQWFMNMQSKYDLHMQAERLALSLRRSSRAARRNIPSLAHQHPWRARSGFRVVTGGRSCFKAESKFSQIQQN
jgi:hypothetical protein